jgi:hypothetical protein
MLRREQHVGSSTSEIIRTRSTRTTDSLSAKAGISPLPPRSPVSTSRSSLEGQRRRKPSGSFAMRDSAMGLQPHRPRPRANKQTTDIVARAFRADPLGAQQKLRIAFLGDAPNARKVTDWIDPRLAGCRDRQKVLVWIRDGAHHSGRNSVDSEVVAITQCVQRAGMVPILVGDALREGTVPAEAVDMILFWKDPIFRGEDARRAQLQFFEHLRDAHGVVGQIGVTTAGMDGPALLGMPTMYLTEVSNVRMREWVGAVPGYREIVRDEGHLERVSRGLTEWCESRPVTASAATTSWVSPR